MDYIQDFAKTAKFNWGLRGKRIVML